MTRFKFVFVAILLFNPVSGFSSVGSVPESRLHSKLKITGPLSPSWITDSLGSTTVGLYTDEGAWDTGVEHLKLFFKDYQYTYRTFSSDQIKNGELATSKIKLLVMPGGESWNYLKKLGEPGAVAIRNFVDHGGRYVGFCAGSFYATSVREGGYATGPYGIGLLEGTAYDGTALGTRPFKEALLDFDLFIQGFAKVFRIALLGGPSFRYTNEEANKKHIEVLAEFQEIHEPAMIRFQYGQGRVFLSGPHPEVEEQKTDWGKDWTDPDSEWPLLNSVIRDLVKN